MAGLGLVGVVGALVAMILQVEEHQHSHKSQQQEGHQNWMGRKEQLREGLWGTHILCTTVYSNGRVRPSPYLGLDSWLIPFPLDSFRISGSFSSLSFQ